MSGGQARSDASQVRGLPAPSSSLIGRENDVGRLIDLLARSRLVTVIGAGGVGKTQLALEAARRMASSFTNGAAFVGLADLDDPTLVATEIARSLDLVDVSGPEPTEGLRSALRSLRMLLVIDNFEHLVGGGTGARRTRRRMPGDHAAGDEPATTRRHC